MQIYYKGRQQKSSIFYAKPDGRHQRSVLLTLLALLAGNAARLYFYNLYQERCMTIDEYTVAGGPLGLAATNGFLIVLLWNLAGLAVLLYGLRRDAADPRLQPV